MNASLALLSLAVLVTTARNEPYDAQPGGSEVDWDEPLQVFLLVGQSNMEGKGAVEHLERALAEGASTEERARYGHLKQGEDWAVRDDVWISYRHGDDDRRAGGLTVGYGGKPGQIGPELGFGTVVGNRLEGRVLLIKCAWGGASLSKDFLPPGSGGPGGRYQRMLDEVRATLSSLDEVFPVEQDIPIQLAGLVWFQGWNDSIGNGNPLYTEQLAQFIRDVRSDLKAPRMPVVIGELGQAGMEPTNHKVIAFRAQQKAVADADEFRDSVRYVPTSPFIDPLLHEQYQVWLDCKRKARLVETEQAKEAAWAPWREIEAEYSARTSDRPYHYFGSGEIFYAMGDAFGRAMLELLEVP